GGAGQPMSAFDMRMEGYRLSPQQARLWALASDAGGAYRSEAVLRVEGALDKERFAAAVERVVRRHEILRTSIEKAPAAGPAMQVIGGESRLVMEWLPGRLLVRVPAWIADARSLQHIIVEICRFYDEASVSQPTEPLQYA